MTANSDRKSKEAERYTKFGNVYREFRDLETKNCCGRSIHQIHDDSKAQMMLVTTILHERAGTNRSFPKLHREAINAALGTDDFGRRVLEDPSFPDAVREKFELLCTKTNRSHTEGPVLGTLRLLQEQANANWTALLRALSPFDAWKMIDGLKGVGPKLSSFMLREFQAFFSIWENVPLTSWYCFMPVDRWVLRAAKLLWQDFAWPDELPHGTEAYRRLANNIANRFPSLEEAMDFNMGAWLLNAMRSQLLAVHGVIPVGEFADDAIHRIAWKLVPKKVVRALRTTTGAGDCLTLTE